MGIKRDATTRGLDTTKLKHKKQLTPVGFLMVCFFLAAAGYFFLQAQVVLQSQPSVSSTFVEQETKATYQLMQQEKEKTQAKQNRTRFAFENPE